MDAASQNAMHLVRDVRRDRRSSFINTASNGLPCLSAVLRDTVPLSEIWPEPGVFMPRQVLAPQRAQRGCGVYGLADRGVGRDATATKSLLFLTGHGVPCATRNESAPRSPVTARSASPQVSPTRFGAPDSPRATTMDHGPWTTDYRIGLPFSVCGSPSAIHLGIGLSMR